MIIKKIREGYIDVPIVSKEDNIQRGIYIMIVKGKIRKVGIFGEGADSNKKKRFSGYRSSGKHLKPGNGSYKTMKVLNEKLEVGDEVEVRFKEAPENKVIDGIVYSANLYIMEKILKNKFKNTLWLS